MFSSAQRPMKKGGKFIEISQILSKNRELQTKFCQFTIQDLTTQQEIFQCWRLQNQIQQSYQKIINQLKFSKKVEGVLLIERILKYFNKFDGKKFTQKFVITHAQYFQKREYTHKWFDVKSRTQKTKAILSSRQMIVLGHLNSFCHRIWICVYLYFFIIQSCAHLALFGVGFYSFTIGNLAQMLEQQLSSKIIQLIWILLSGVSKLLPFMIHCSIQSVKSYIILDHQDIYILIVGEVLGQSLLNLIEGSKFGEIEILDEDMRKQSAIAIKNFFFIIFFVQVFLVINLADQNLLLKQNNQVQGEKFQSRKAISNSIHFYLLYFLKNQKVLTKNYTIFLKQKLKISNNLSEFIKYTKLLLQFAKAVGQLSQNEQHKPRDRSNNIMVKGFKYSIQFKFLNEVTKVYFSRNQERKWTLFSKIQKCWLDSDEIQQTIKETSQKGRYNYLGLIITNNVKEEMQNKFIITKEIFKLQKEKTNNQNSKVNNLCKIGIIIQNSYYSFTILLSVIKGGKIINLEKKEKEAEKGQKQKMKKIDQFYQIRKFNDFLNKLQNELIFFNNLKAELRYWQMEVVGVYFQTQL
ncbi:unnamed protein product [Paramecium octaurelia]|uniref:Transmembrane protein n=1 Tax=Paramecium octaurelia TaxID=43137 RepID=A0A8S1UIQ5_PAROT|nr:unnamed protein product [Paramecium octaurelia]